MTFQRIYNIITANVESNDYFKLRKEIVVRVFLHVAFIVLISFTLVNILYKEYLLALLDLSASLISLYAIKKLQNNHTLNLAVKISSFNIFFFFLLFVFLNGNNDNGLFWVMFVPLFIIPLNGYKKGTIISILFYLITFIVAYLGIDEWQNGTWNFHSYLRFVISSLILLYVSYINEFAIHRSNLLLYQRDKEKKEYLRQIEDAANLDYMTQIYNRRKINELLEFEFKRAKRYDTTFCVAIIDIDFFKKINDTFGHNRGDDVLITFSQTIKNSIRETDIFGRWGGEEFILIFTNSNIEQSFYKCEKIRKAIENSTIEELNITCSIGIETYAKELEDITELIHRADQALYKAKETGRNRVVCYNESTL